jgi:exosortase A-associated hydrolase 2
MAAITARELARSGILVLQIDLKGCGDSAGNFEDAKWGDWLDDVSTGWDWLQRECGDNLGLWTARAGSLVAADWLWNSTEQPPLIMWQPVTQGKQHLTQFLRLEAAREMLSSEESKGVVTTLWNRIRGGGQVEVAGYRLTPDLVEGFENAKMRLAANYKSPIRIFEVVSSASQGLSPGMTLLIDRLKEQSISIHGRHVNGSSFWRAQEIEVVPELAGFTTIAAKELLNVR